MESLPKVMSVRAPAPNFPDNIEVTVQWDGEYVSMLTFHKSDFEGDAAKARVIIDAHVKMIGRKLDLLVFTKALEEFRLKHESVIVKAQMEIQRKRMEVELGQQKLNS